MMKIQSLHLPLFSDFMASLRFAVFMGTCCSWWGSLPPLLSSVLPEDSVGEADAIMGIFDRWSSITFVLKLKWNLDDLPSFLAQSSRSVWLLPVVPSQQVRSPAELLLWCSLWCGDADGLGSCHQLPLVAQLACPPSGRRGSSLSVGAPRWQLLKRDPGGWRGED